MSSWRHYQAIGNLWTKCKLSQVFKAVLFSEYQEETPLENEKLKNILLFFCKILLGKIDPPIEANLDNIELILLQV